MRAQHTHTHAHAHMRMHMRMYMHMYMRMYMYIRRMYIRTSMHMYMYMRMYMRMCMRMYMHMYMCIYIIRIHGLLAFNVSVLLCLYSASSTGSRCWRHALFSTKHPLPEGSLMVAEIDSLKLLFGNLRWNVPTAKIQIDTCKTSVVCKRINLQANQRAERTTKVLGDSPAKTPSSKSKKHPGCFTNGFWEIPFKFRC